MPYTSETNNDVKRAVRAFIHSQTRKHFPRAKTFTMLAGGVPRHEVTAIKTLYQDGHLLAVDRDEKCVKLAIKAGADAGLCCDLAETRPRKADVFFLDLCGFLGDPVIQTVENCASQARQMMLVTILRKREKYADTLRRWGAARRQFADREEWMDPLYTLTQQIADNRTSGARGKREARRAGEIAIGRVLELQHAMGQSSNLTKVCHILLYQSGVSPMMTVIFGAKDAKIWKPYVQHYGNALSLLDVFRQVAHDHGPETAMRICDM
jgi:hypothetical protein